MSPAPPNEGFRNDALRAALSAALAGRPAQLEDLLGRHGGGHDRRPNLRLAAAFGAEMATLTAAPGTAARLLARLGGDDAAPDTPRVFLPIAAAHGWVGRLRAGRDVDLAWPALAELAADERAPVRLGALDALTSFAARGAGAGQLVKRAIDWLELDDREQCFGAAALAIEVLADRRVLSSLGDPRRLLDYLSAAIAAAAQAPRSFERSPARRRLLQALPRTLAAVVAVFDEAQRGATWLEAECAQARHPDVREALSSALLELNARSQPGPGSAVAAQRLRSALEGSAKPPRDPTRRRPGAARGKATRRVR
jgi:hypothetical protein